MSLALIQQLIDGLVRDDNGKISAADRDEAIKLAVEQYSQDRPKRTVEDIASGAGGQTLALPVAWETDFSAIESLEYPIGSIPPELIDSDRWQMYRTPTGEQIQLIYSIAASVNVRATYSKRHTLDSGIDTVPVKDREAFAKLVAASLCDRLAAQYSNNSDSTIQADTVDHKSQASDYRALAKAYRAAYQNMLGVADKRPQPSAAVVQLRSANSLGRPRMTHDGLPLSNTQVIP